MVILVGVTLQHLLQVVLGCDDAAAAAAHCGLGFGCFGETVGF